MKKSVMRKIVLLSCMLLSNVSFASLQLELTKGIGSSLPIAVVPFAGEAGLDDSQKVSQIVANDLRNSGQFNIFPVEKIKDLSATADNTDYGFWASARQNNVVIGHVTPMGGSYQVSFDLLDVYQGTLGKTAKGDHDPRLVHMQFTVHGKQMRAVAHHISDVIYKQLTGNRGVFSTKLAYVLVQEGANHKRSFQLMVADVDGFNPKTILVSHEPIMSPAWSPDGSRIAYVSFENRRAAIYIQSIASGGRERVSNAPGINGAPAWSPDGRQMALVLSLTGEPKIYIMNLGTRRQQQVTFGSSIDTEPNWSPDGKSISFTSNRGGGPQIYALDVSTQNIKRLTFDGRYNATGSYFPDGKSLAVLHRDDNYYNIAIQDLSSGGMMQITRRSDDSSPSIAPNGQMIVYADGQELSSVLGMVSSDGKIKLRLPSPEGGVREPAWSPYLNVFS